MGTVQALRDVEGKKPVGLADVQAAAARIGDSIIRTPCLESRTLSEITGARVFLKFENLQFTAAYKERGARTKLLLLDETAKTRGVNAESAGNHAPAMTHHGSRPRSHVPTVLPPPAPHPNREGVADRRPWRDGYTGRREVRGCLCPCG